MDVIGSEALSVAVNTHTLLVTWGLDGHIRSDRVTEPRPQRMLQVLFVTAFQGLLDMALSRFCCPFGVHLQHLKGASFPHTFSHTHA